MKCTENYRSLIDKLKSQVKLIKVHSYTLMYVYQHPQTPWYAKLSIFLTLGYLLSPIDLIPDFIPLLGYLDDLILVPLLITLSIKLIPTNIFQECEGRARSDLERTSKRKKSAWWFAALIILFYTIVLLLILRRIRTLF